LGAANNGTVSFDRLFSVSSVDFDNKLTGYVSVSTCDSNANG